MKLPIWKCSVLTLMSAFCFSAYATLTSVHINKQDDFHHEIIVTLPADAEHSIDKNSIQISVDHPDIQITQWTTSNNYEKQYHEQYKEQRKLYTSPCTITARISSANDQLLADTCLHIGYFQNAQKGMIHEQIPLGSPAKKETLIETSADASGVVQSTISLPIKPKSPASTPLSWSARLSKLVETTDSIVIRLLLVMLLGLLMSLTPCIYPMIPITVGILQSQGSKSLWHNLALSLAYTTGIAITFATLGLTAALTGQIFGSLMGNPLFILAVVGVLAYLGFSMLGFYDMYTPRFMRNANSGAGGSITAAFLFGAASGTVASPCLSPGLILLLSIVATLGSKFLGFILLFAFGIGLSIPLLLIGTFSSSLMLLPRAGMWMVEIKKFFGILLFAMCFYFLNNIVPWTLLLGMITVSSLGAGIFYLYSIAPYDTKVWRTIKHMSGMTFIAASVFLAMQTFQSMYLTTSSQHQETVWHTNYHDARALATKDNKRLFIDIGAPYCSICKAIDRTVLSHPRVIEQLTHVVAVKIDASEETEIIADLQKKYTIKGVPTLLLLHHDGTLIKQWGSELYDMPIDEFINQITI